MHSFVVSVMETVGVFGIALLMFLENIFPPIPSELIMPLAGYRASQDGASIVAVIVAGSIGSLLGVVPWYYAGRALGKARVKRLSERYGRWLTLSPGDVEAASDWFRRHGSLAVLLGRLVPTVRTLISVPAGVARMPLWKFLAYSAVGTAIWTSGLALTGYLLGQAAFELVQDYIEPVSNVVFAIIVIVYLYRVATFDPKRRSEVAERAEREER